MINKDEIIIDLHGYCKKAIEVLTEMIEDTLEEFSMNYDPQTGEKIEPDHELGW